MVMPALKVVHLNNFPPNHTFLKKGTYFSAEILADFEEPLFFANGSSIILFRFTAQPSSSPDPTILGSYRTSSQPNTRVYCSVAFAESVAAVDSEGSTGGDAMRDFLMFRKLSARRREAALKEGDSATGSRHCWRGFG